MVCAEVCRYQRGQGLVDETGKRCMPTRGHTQRTRVSAEEAVKVETQQWFLVTALRTRPENTWRAIPLQWGPGVESQGWEPLMWAANKARPAMTCMVTMTWPYWGRKLTPPQNTSHRKGGQKLMQQPKPFSWKKTWRKSQCKRATKGNTARLSPQRWQHILNTNAHNLSGKLTLGCWTLGVLLCVAELKMESSQRKCQHETKPKI